MHTHTHTLQLINGPDRLTCPICASLKLYNVGTGSCADYPRGQGLQGGAMNIAPCSGTGSQVPVKTVVSVKKRTGLHPGAKMICLVIAALRSKL